MYLATDLFRYEEPGLLDRTAKKGKMFEDRTTAALRLVERLKAYYHIAA